MTGFDDNLAQFEELDEQRRRIMEEFNLLVQLLREGASPDPDRIRREAHHLHVRHESILREMIMLRA